MNNYKAKFEIEGYEVTQRHPEELAKGEKLRIDEDLCFILLPKEWSGKNVVLVRTEL
jgi:hypothetical protein